jgi:hypothetical protein
LASKTTDQQRARWELEVFFQQGDINTQPILRGGQEEGDEERKTVVY